MMGKSLYVILLMKNTRNRQHLRLYIGNMHPIHAAQFTQISAIYYIWIESHAHFATQ